MNRGRALGPGRLMKRGSTWTLVFTDEHGQRRRVGLSSDRRTAERLRADVIRKRDLARSGLASEAGQEMMLDEPRAAVSEAVCPLDGRQHIGIEPGFRKAAVRRQRGLEEQVEMHVHAMMPAGSRFFQRRSFIPSAGSLEAAGVLV